MDESFYKKHIFVCTNIKNQGKCCGSNPIASELVKTLKSIVSDKGLKGKNGVRVTASGCMGRCEEGPVAVIYPEGTWFAIKSEKEQERLKQSIA